jgi:hypothetical protein
VRIALKSVSADSPTPDATPAKSSSGSFLDILTQGTQDAVQAAKGASSQSQSDAHSSSPNNSDDTQSQEPSSQTIPGASTPVAIPRNQTAAAVNPSGTQQIQYATGATQAAPAQSLSNVLTFLSPTAQSDKAAIATEAVQAAESPADQTVPSGKQSGATKGTQGKQATPASTGSQSSSLQQMLAALQQPLSIPEAVTATVQVATGSAQAQSQQDQPASSANATPALAVDSVAQGIVQYVANQEVQHAKTQSSVSQSHPDSNSLAGSQLQHDPTDVTPSPAKTLVPDTSADASAFAQTSGQKPVQPFPPTAPSQWAASTYLAAPPAQNDTVSSQTSAKVIPFKVSAANFSANSSSAASTGANAATAPAPAIAVTKNNSFSSTSSGDSQAGNDGTSRTLADNSTSTSIAFRVTDPGMAQTTVQTTALGATPHQASSTSSSDDGTSAHADEGHGLPSAQAASLPAGSAAINSARVIQSMNETEMRVGMRSSEFGDISIRTSVTQQQMQAQISVDHSELVSALSAHIPAVQAKLGADYGLHASIEVSQGGASFSGNQGQSSQKDYKPFTPFAHIDGVASPTESDKGIVRPAAATVGEGSRLDIRA